MVGTERARRLMMVLEEAWLANSQNLLAAVVRSEHRCGVDSADDRLQMMLQKCQEASGLEDSWISEEKVRAYAAVGAIVAIKPMFELTGDFELMSEIIVFVSMTFYSKRAVISTVFMEVPRGSMHSIIC